MNNFLTSRLRFIIAPFCIVMGLGGAVNEGFSAWTMSLPFIFLLWYMAATKDKCNLQSKRFNWSWRGVVLLFFFFIITVSHTQYKNPILYPIIKDGHVITIRDGSIRNFVGDRNNYWMPKLLDEKLFDKERVLKMIPKGTRLAVTGIYADTGDLYQRVGLVLTDGTVSFYVDENQWKTKPKSLSKNVELPDTDNGLMLEQSIQPEGIVQSDWARRLGKLMLWPVFPIMILGL